MGIIHNNSFLLLSPMNLSTMVFQRNNNGDLEVNHKGQKTHLVALILLLCVCVVPMFFSLQKFSICIDLHIKGELHI